MPILRKIAPLLWTLVFLFLANLALDRITRFQEPPVVTDHRKIFDFARRGSAEGVLVLGSSRVRSFQPLEESLPPGSVTALPVSGGGMSTLRDLWMGRLAPKFAREGRFPRELWLAVQPSDFHATDNFNRAAVIWGWDDFLLGLADGIGDMDRNFLMSRVYDWFTWFAPIIDRNERVAFAKVLEAAGAGGPASSIGGPDQAGAAALRAQALDGLDPRELDAAADLIADIRKRGSAVTLIRMPLAPSVEALQDSAAREAFDARIDSLYRRLGAAYHVLDGARLGLAGDDFGPDLIHLRPIGDAKFSEAVAALLIRKAGANP